RRAFALTSECGTEMMMMMAEWQDSGVLGFTGSGVALRHWCAPPSPGLERPGYETVVAPRLEPPILYGSRCPRRRFAAEA
ncbi:MAG: hypothetical protein ACAH88_14395, partial [Roseimicrobium sp.]